MAKFFEYQGKEIFKKSGIPIPEELDDLKHPLIVGLTINPDRLVEIRRNRLLTLHDKNESDYIDMEAIKAELAHARRLFSQRGWPVIDVTRRSIEETAAAILNVYNRRVADKEAS